VDTVRSKAVSRLPPCHRTPKHRRLPPAFTISHVKYLLKSCLEQPRNLEGRQQTANQPPDNPPRFGLRREVPAERYATPLSRERQIFSPPAITARSKRCRRSLSAAALQNIAGFQPSK